MIQIHVCCLKNPRFYLFGRLPLKLDRMTLVSTIRAKVIFIEKPNMHQELCSMLSHIFSHLITVSLLDKNNFPHFTDGKTKTHS